MVLNKFVKHSEVPNISKSNSNNKLKPLTIMLKLTNTIDINWNIINKECLKPSRLFLFFENYHHYIVVSSFCFRPESWRTLDYSKKKRSGKRWSCKYPCIHSHAFTASPLHVNDFCFESAFVSPICSKSNKVSLGTQPHNTEQQLAYRDWHTHWRLWKFATWRFTCRGLTAFSTVVKPRVESSDASLKYIQDLFSSWRAFFI